MPVKLLFVLDFPLLLPLVGAFPLPLLSAACCALPPLTAADTAQMGAFEDALKKVHGGCGCLCVVGEDIVLAPWHISRDYSIHTLTYTETLVLEYPKMIAILESGQFLYISRVMRRHALRLLLLRALLLLGAAPGLHAGAHAAGRQVGLCSTRRCPPLPTHLLGGSR